MAKPRDREETGAPLGAWLWKTAQAKGFATQTDLIRALKVQGSTFYDWSGAVASVPSSRTVIKIRDVLGLTRDERAALDEVIREQRLVNEERTAARASGEPTPQTPATADVTTQQVVVYDDIYPNRAAAVEITTSAVLPEVIAAVRRIRNADGDLPIKRWIAMIREMDEAMRNPTVPAASAGPPPSLPDLFDVKASIETAAPPARGRKKAS